MKIPKEVKLYCEKCKKHTKHKLKTFKEGKKSILKEHARKHEIKHNQGYGGKSRFITHVKKQGKRPTFVATCEICGTKKYHVIENRTRKKPEFV